jgi:PPM family protein phosphatase
LQRSPKTAIHGSEMANTATVKPAKPQVPPASAVAPSFATSRAFAMLSHRGRVRHVNQDACAALPELGAFVVCDGIGGAAAGEVASHLATEAFLHAISQPDSQPARRIPPKSASIPGTTAAHPHTRLQEAIRAANQAVFRHSRKSEGLHGMGTTLVSVLIEYSATPSLSVAHVGDSRCYRLRRNEIQLLTQDHSLVEEHIRAGILTRAQASRSPIRNIITRAIGSQPNVEPEIATHDAQSGDLFLLATDGLTRELPDAEIAHILTDTLPNTAALESACQTLIDAANRKGGRDNITVLLIACP